MKSLYESILDNDIVSKADKEGARFLKGEEILRKMKPELDKIFQASTEFPMRDFLEDHGFRLDKDTVKKIVGKLKKKLPPNARFGRKYGVRQLADQHVEDYGSARSNPPYGFYRIEIEYVTDGHRPGSISTSSVDEEILHLYEAVLYALEIPETKDMLDKLDEYFEDYTTKEEIKISNSYTLKSKVGGKYRIYDFHHLKKELL
jgi:hypothetical protein